MKFLMRLSTKLSTKFSRTWHHRTIYGKAQAFMLEKYIQSITVLNHYHNRSKIMELVPEDIEQSQSFDSFKSKINIRYL